MGDHQLHHDRHQTHQGQGRQQRRPVPRQPYGHQGHGRQQQLPENKALALDPVTQRHDQQQPHGITGLGRTHHPADARLRYPQIGGHRLQQRLGNVHRGNGHGASERQQQRQRSRQTVRRGALDR
ncbi:hypothetical protein D3C71_1722590 [compost metagenome]